MGNTVFSTLWHCDCLTMKKKSNINSLINHINDLSIEEYKIINNHVNKKLNEYYKICEYYKNNEKKCC